MVTVPSRETAGENGPRSLTGGRAQCQEFACIVEVPLAGRYDAGVSHRAFKQPLYREFARIGAALASDRRLELLDVLANGPRHVDALAAEADLTVANASQHLQVLRQARLVDAERQGTRVIYRLADDSVLRLWLALRDVAASRLAEVAVLARERGVGDFAADAISRDEYERMRAEQDAVLIDVRPRSEFEHGHLDDALSMPLDELQRRLAELPRDRPIVAYCRGAYCLFAADAVAILRERGFHALRLEDGWTEWSKARVLASTV